MIEVTGLRVGYGPTTVIHDLDLSIREGSVSAILGPNGAGKTTLLKTLAGQLKPLRGRIEMAGKNLTRTSAPVVVRAGVSLVPEGRRIFPDLSVLENLLVGGHCRRGKAEVRAEAEDFLDRWPVIGRRRDGAAGNLSGGEQQVLALGRALMGAPRILLLDEPSLGLAPVLIDQIYTLISEVAETGITILLVEQNPVQALKVSDEVRVLVGGRIVGHGLAEEITPDEVVSMFFHGDMGGGR